MMSSHIPKYSLISLVLPQCKNLLAGNPTTSFINNNKFRYYNKVYKKEYIDVLEKNNVSLYNIFNESILVSNKYKQLNLITEFTNGLEVNIGPYSFQEHFEILNANKKFILLYELKYNNTLISKHLIQNYNPTHSYLPTNEGEWLNTWYNFQDVIKKLK